MENSFKKVIGYDDVKEELLEICDMVKNKEVYSKLGAKMPKGVLLYGVPGIGKTLMSECFIEESGLKCFTVRKGKGSEKLMQDIGKVFDDAKKNAPSIVFLDDMDKFSNEDSNRPNGEEYIAVQAGIDLVKDSDVLVIATVNDVDLLPSSLVRAGRFDRKIKMTVPLDEECLKIITHYLSDKKVSPDVNLTDIAKMMSYSSCAELETIVNEASIKAGRERRKDIGMNNIVSAVLKMQYNSPDNLTEVDPIELEKTALHEAGHLVCSEILSPGSVGLASVRLSKKNSVNGFIHCCKDNRDHYIDIITGLGGKAAVELYYARNFATGCNSDLKRATAMIKRGIESGANLGFSALDKSVYGQPNSAQFVSSSEAIITTELERYMLITRDILLKNRTFLEKVRDALIEKRVLLSSDIEKIKSECEIINVAI